LQDYDDDWEKVPMRAWVYAYAEAGEEIHVASSAVGIESGAIELYAPGKNPTVDTPDENFTSGCKITNRTEEVNRTYSTCSETVGPSETGIWTIHIVSPYTDKKGEKAPPEITVDTDWAEQTDEDTYITAWDVTVKNGGTEQTGRVFSRYLPFDMGVYTNDKGDFSALLYVLTDNGTPYKINTNGIRPFRFIFFSNNKGFVDSSTEPESANPVYKSVETEYFHKPSDPDAGDTVTHKIFFNEPDTNMPAAATYKGDTIDLYPDYTPAPEPANLEFEGKDGTANRASSVNRGGTFSFENTSSTEDARYTLVIDVDQNGTFGDGNDTILDGVASAGTTTDVSWNGNDGDGNPVTVGNYTARVRLRSGEVHFPFLDAEIHENGFIFERLLGKGQDELTLIEPNHIYFDNSELDTYAEGGRGKTIPPETALEGIDSLAKNGANKWDEDDENGAAAAFGHERGIDTWTFVPSLNTVTLDITVTGSDLSLTATADPSSVQVGDNVVFTIEVKNDGTEDTTGVAAQVTLPANLDYVSDDSSGAFDTSSSTWTIGNLANGDTATLKITAKSDTADDYTLTAEVSASDQGDGDSTPGNMVGTTVAEDDEATADVSVVEADLSLTATADPSSVQVGDNVVFTIEVKNDGTEDATGVAAQVTLPTNLEHVSDDSGGDYDPDTGIWTIGDLANGDTATLKITASSDTADDYTLTAEVSASDQGDDDSTPGNMVGTTVAEDDEATAVVSFGNTPPTADDQEVTTPENTAKTITLTGSDPEDDELTYTITDPPANGTLYQVNNDANGTRGAEITNPGTDVTNTDNKVLFVPDPDESGDDYATFNFKVNDGTADSADATVTINVTADDTTRDDDEDDDTPGDDNVRDDDTRDDDTADDTSGDDTTGDDTSNNDGNTRDDDVRDDDTSDDTTGDDTTSNDDTTGNTNTVRDDDIDDDGASDNQTNENDTSNTEQQVRDDDDHNARSRRDNPDEQTVRMPRDGQDTGTPVSEQSPDQAVDEEPVAEEPVAEEPVAEEPVAEEPVAEEPVAEEPVAEEPVAEEPVAEEPVAEEPVAEEPVAEEPVAEEPVAEEPAENPVADNTEDNDTPQPVEEQHITFIPMVIR
jgi:uncharacterized repeat protein (TIGR01451 family)